MFQKLKRNYPKIRTQMFIQLLIIASAVTLILMVSNSQFVTNIYLDRSRNKLIDTAKFLNELDYSNRDEYVKKIFDWEDKYVNLYVEVFDKKDDFVYSSMLYNLSIGSDSSIDENFSLIKRRKLIYYSTDIVKKGYSFYTCKEDDDHREFIVLTTSLDNGMFVKLYLLKDSVTSTARFFRIIIDAISILFTVIFSGAMLIYSKLFVNPIVKIIKKTDRMANMDFTEKCEIPRNHELGNLARNINYLSDSLNRTLNELKEKNIKLESDIEYERKLEKSRLDFVSNVSHELKTPISIIRGYAEGLLFNITLDDKSKEEYCKIIIDETNRMNKLIIDLLNLSKLNNANFILEKKSFLIHELINFNVNAHSIIFKEKEITVDVDIDENMIGYGDISKLELVVNNFVSNAISYCKNEKIIKISSKEIDDNYRISVYNSGNQISEKHINELWNNFFRCDESHKRDENHFGIGLSISKTIQNLHEMKYGVENKPDGVEFWFDIQKFKS